MGLRRRGSEKRTAVGGVEAAFYASGPLELADDAVGAFDFFPEPGELLVRVEITGGSV